MICTRCHTDKPHNDYYATPRKPYGWCIQCHRDYRNAWKKTHPNQPKHPNKTQTRCIMCSRWFMSTRPGQDTCGRRSCTAGYELGADPMALPTSCCGRPLEFGTIDVFTVEWCAVCGQNATKIRGIRMYDQRDVLEKEMAGVVDRATNPVIDEGRAGRGRIGKKYMPLIVVGARWGVGKHPWNQKTRVSTSTQVEDEC